MIISQLSQDLWRPVAVNPGAWEWPIYYLATGGDQDKAPQAMRNEAGQPIVMPYVDERQMEEMSTSGDIWVTNDGNRGHIVKGTRVGLNAPLPADVHEMIAWNRLSSSATRNPMKIIVSQRLTEMHSTGGGHLDGWSCNGGRMSSLAWVGYTRRLTESNRLWITIVDTEENFLVTSASNNPFGISSGQCHTRSLHSTLPEAFSAVLNLAATMRHTRTLTECALAGNATHMGDQSMVELERKAVGFLESTGDWPCEADSDTDREIIRAAASLARKMPANASANLWDVVRTLAMTGFADPSAAHSEVIATEGTALKVWCNDGPTARSTFFWMRFTDNAQVDLEASDYTTVEVETGGGVLDGDNRHATQVHLPVSDAFPVAKRHVDRLNSRLAEAGLDTRAKVENQSPGMLHMAALPGEGAQCLAEARNLGFVRNRAMSRGRDMRFELDANPDHVAVDAKENRYSVIMTEDYHAQYAAADGCDSAQAARSGRFIEVQSGRDITNQTFSGMVMHGTSKPALSVETANVPVPPKTNGQLVRAHLSPSDEWDWTLPGHIIPAALVRVDTLGQRHYGVTAQFECPVTMAVYPDNPMGHRLRPTARGEVSLGPIVGEVLVNGMTKPQPVHEYIVVQVSGSPKENAAQ